MDYLAGLNVNQRQAVEFTEGYLRVIAGAGSGKTKLLVSRYAHLVKAYGIDSANILCVTFTNKAAGEMRRRINNLIGEEYDTSLICTYHGFCVKVLREDIDKLFYPKEFQVLDNVQQKGIIQEIYKKLELKLDYASFEHIMKIINGIKTDEWYVPRMSSTEKCQILNKIETFEDKIVEAYLQIQKRMFALDFSDLINFTLYLFGKFPEIKAKWQDKLNYIQVDEFQDSSRREMKLVDILCEKYGNLMIVGDPDQNIYQWRGSDVKLLVDFDKNHVPTHTIFLNQNYRSTSQILTCANKLIKKNGTRVEKELFTENTDTTPVIHFHMKNEYEEANNIVEQITKIRKETGCGYSSFAILYRSGVLSRVLENKLSENGIPYEIFGGLRFFQRMEVQDVLSYLRVIAYDDDLSFKRVINVPRRRFGRTKLVHLTEVQKDGESLYTTLKNNLNDPIFRQSDAGKFVDFIENMRKRYKSMDISEIIGETCSGSGYEKYISELGDMERFENLSEFKRISCEFEKNFGEDISLEEFLNQISLQISDEEDEDKEMVKLMTIHAAKGLEFPYVFVIGCSEGIFPSSKTIEERKIEGLEEERRLCYVAITRAEKQLFLSDSEGYTSSGRAKMPSRFLSEIGEENYIRVGKISEELLHKVNEEKTKNNQEIDSTKYKVGDVVEHPIFGKGVIREVDESRRSLKIQFAGVKRERNIAMNFFERKNEPEKKEDFEEVDRIVIPKGSQNQGGGQSQQQPQPQSQQQPSSQSNSTPDVINIQNSNDSNNLWKRDDVPKTGWRCVGVSDMGTPCVTCEMCGRQIIRYVHHMEHDNYRPLGVGCVCAGRMEGDIEGARKRENELKKKQNRKENYMKKKWKQSKNGNPYTKAKTHLVVLYKLKGKEKWIYSIDSRFCEETYNTKEEAMEAAFEVLDKMK